MSLLESILNNVPQGDGVIVIIGDETVHPLSSGNYQKTIQHYGSLSDGVSKISDFIKSALKIDVLRISSQSNTNAVFDYYRGLISEGGLVVVDGQEFVPDTISGTFTLIFRDDTAAIYRRESIVQDIPFAIVMATYHRTNGMTKRFVERSIASIANQNYKNYKLFLMGDRYENEVEFEEFKKLLPAERIQTVNLPVALERDTCKNKMNLWCIGGANAMNAGMDLAVDQGFKHYVHLDDDDYWHPSHLRNVATGYQQFPEATFICTYAMGPMVLPITNGFRYDNFNCRGGSAYHSSFGFRLDLHPFRYATLQLGIPEVPFNPADADLLNRVDENCKRNGYKTLAI